MSNESAAEERSGELTGSPSDSGYRAAVDDVAFFDRTGHARLSLKGRAPEQVLLGLVSGKIPASLAPFGPELWRGRAEGSALLTAKGRMVAVLRLLRGGPSAEDGFRMDVPAACREAAIEHIRRFVPPRLATLTDDSAESGMITLLGPRAADLLCSLLGSLDAEALRALTDGDLLQATSSEGAFTVIRTTEVATSAYDVVAPAAETGRLLTALAAAAVPRLEEHAWETLRIEAGTPAFGVDMDESTIPVEAGIQARVVDYQKGCFTGQEVLIRIRDRGHVNRHLRGIRLPGPELPAPGTELFVSGEERAVGHVTSAARSPRFGAVALGYVRREVVPPTELRLGEPTGPPAAVEALETWFASPAAGSR